MGIPGRSPGRATRTPGPWGIVGKGSQEPPVPDPRDSRLLARGRTRVHSPTMRVPVVRLSELRPGATAGFELEVDGERDRAFVVRLARATSAPT